MNFQLCDRLLALGQLWKHLSGTAALPVDAAASCPRRSRRVTLVLRVALGKSGRRGQATAFPLPHPILQHACRSCTARQDASCLMGVFEPRGYLNVRVTAACNRVGVHCPFVPPVYPHRIKPRRTQQVRDSPLTGFRTTSAARGVRSGSARSVTRPWKTGPGQTDARGLSLGNFTGRAAGYEDLCLKRSSHSANLSLDESDGVGKVDFNSSRVAPSESSFLATAAGPLDTPPAPRP